MWFRLTESDTIRICMNKQAEGQNRYKQYRCFHAWILCWWCYACYSVIKSGNVTHPLVAFLTRKSFRVSVPSADKMLLTISDFGKKEGYLESRLRWSVCWRWCVQWVSVSWRRRCVWYSYKWILRSWCLHQLRWEASAITGFWMETQDKENEWVPTRVTCYVQKKVLSADE